MRGSESLVRELLKLADVETDGSRPWDIRVRNPEFYSAVLGGGSLALGESYMAGWWDCDDLTELINRILRAELRRRVRPSTRLIWAFLRARLTNGRRNRAFEVGERHYDLGNSLFRNMLDRRMVYTCGYWRGVEDLDSAQEAKLDLVCRKIGLRPGMRVLDIGCGWGSFLKYAAERYGAQGVGITVSREQAALAREMCRDLPIEIEVRDYRDLRVREPFDRIVSLGMFEHVGEQNYRTYMRAVRSALKPEGLFLLHTIGRNTSTRYPDPWFQKYIFPQGMLPSVAQIGRATEGAFVMEDWHNFGPDYEKTLLAWHRNFETHWPELAAAYGERFHRMWRYYLLASAAGFRSRHINLWQVILSPRGVPGGYISVR